MEVEVRQHTETKRPARHNWALPLKQGKLFSLAYNLVNYIDVFGKVFLIFETYYVCDERYRIARKFRYIEFILNNFFRRLI
jgi:hypothetical protein